jgi:hypothetical protein
MRLLHTRALTSTAAIAIGAVLVLAPIASITDLVATSGAPAGASTVPPWEPDPSSVGGLVLYNAAGDVITGGSTTASPLAAYVEGTATIRSGDKRATLYGYLPVKGQAPGAWSGEALDGSTVYPNGSAPAPLNTSALPVVTGVSGDETIAQLAVDFPNNDTSNDGYAGMYVLRLRTSGKDEGSTITYDSADIQISGSTWSVVYTKAGAASTTTSLTVAPTSGVVFGETVKLAASVTPKAVAGTVAFHSGLVLVGRATVSGGVAKLSTAGLPGGTDKLTATFTPTNSKSYAVSTSTVHTLVVKAHATTTGLKASAASIKKGAKETLTADVAPAAVAGQVTFYDGSKKLAVVTVHKGVAVFSTAKLPVGSNALKATFTPSIAADDKTSTSKVVKVSVAS